MATGGTEWMKTGGSSSGGVRAGGIGSGGSSAGGATMGGNKSGGISAEGGIVSSGGLPSLGGIKTGGTRLGGASTSGGTTVTGGNWGGNVGTGGTTVVSPSSGGNTAATGGVSGSAGNTQAQIIEEETGVGKAYDQVPSDKVLVTKVKHYGIVSWKIAAAGGTFYFETGNDNPKGSTGFHSAFDKHWNDWIGNDADKNYISNPPDFCTGGNQWRGFPQLLEDNFDHPQTQKFPGGKTRWTDADGKELTFINWLEAEHLVLHSFNAANEVEYHFFPSHAAIKVIKVGAPYAFLWEGSIGGDTDQGPKDYYVLEDGLKSTTFWTTWTLSAYANKQWPSPFLYLVDSDEKKTQILFLGAKGLNEDREDEGWIQKDPCRDSNFNQQLFSFGRGSNKRSLTGTNAIAVFGFLPKSEHAAISEFIHARLADPFKLPVKVQ